MFLSFAMLSSMDVFLAIVGAGGLMGGGWTGTTGEGAGGGATTVGAGGLGGGGAAAAFWVASISSKAMPSSVESLLTRSRLVVEGFFFNKLMLPADGFRKTTRGALPLLGGVVSFPFAFGL